jgi:membrane protease YdiL (CAAX protease family)
LITAIGEEIGWRGYLVPATLERVGIKKALIYTSIFWGVWHLPILISGLYMPGTPAWYSVPAFLFMIIPVGMIY